MADDSVLCSPIDVYFGLFGERRYDSYRVIDAEIGTAQVACRWCVGADWGNCPTERCVACKRTGWIWIGV